MRRSEFGVSWRFVVAVVVVDVLLLAGAAWGTVSQRAAGAGTSQAAGVKAVEPWWSGAGAGLVGGIGGSVVGLMGAFIGVAASRGAMRRTVMGTMGGMIVIGAAGLGVGAAALASSQPYAVWYPPVLLGFLCVVLPLS